MTEYRKNYEAIEVKIASSPAAARRHMTEVAGVLNGLFDHFSLHLPSACKELNQAASSVISGYSKALPAQAQLIAHACFDDEELLDSIHGLTLVGELLLENPSGIVDYKEYLKKLEGVMTHNKNEKVKLCLDVGHLLFDMLKSRKTPEDFLEILAAIGENPNLQRHIRQIHLHDCSELEDHLNLGEGRMPLGEVGQLLSKHFPGTPLIFEVSLPDILSGAVNPLRLLENGLT
ncbi:hypothetical protein [Gorillibacterium sp. sgz500922]|uniref:hypothetical protein n=1 Tax=Gorillibacterium sp. sgz500922 TaxID=3446694 RepID=UPI003F663321